MWWDVRGKLDGKIVRYRVEALNQAIAQTLVQWKGIEILAMEPERPLMERAPQTTLLEAFGPFVGDVPPTLSE